MSNMEPTNKTNNPANALFVLKFLHGSDIKLNFYFYFKMNLASLKPEGIHRHLGFLPLQIPSL
jgi:hypothetical protein